MEVQLSKKNENVEILLNELIDRLDLKIKKIKSINKLNNDTEDEKKDSFYDFERHSEAATPIVKLK